MRAMTPEQRSICRRFLAELRRTGNVKWSAERVGVARQTLHARRRANPAFATEWRAALAFARVALAAREPQLPRTKATKTEGGEYSVRNSRGGLQVQRAHPGELTAEGERLFLATLAATANVTLAHQAVGVSDSAIYLRRRRSDHFADRMDAALACGHERLEFALMESALYSLGPEEMIAGWLELGLEAPSPLMTMTFEQVIISMGMHMKRVVLGQKRRAHNEHVTQAEETDAAITKLLDKLNKRAKAQERYDWEAEEAKRGKEDRALE